MGRAGGERSWAARSGWATIRAAAAHSFFDSDVTRSNCGAAALPLPLRTCGVPSGQSVRALPRANSGWGGLGAAVRSALPRVRRVAGRVRVEKRVIGHIFALGCRVVVCFGTAEYEWTGLATRARPRRAVPLAGSDVVFRKSTRRLPHPAYDGPCLARRGRAEMAASTRRAWAPGTARGERQASKPREAVSAASRRGDRATARLPPLSASACKEISHTNQATAYGFTHHSTVQYGYSLHCGRRRRRHLRRAGRRHFELRFHCNRRRQRPWLPPNTTAVANQGDSEAEHDADHTGGHGDTDDSSDRLR